MSGWENPTIAGLLIGIPSTLIAIWGIWRSLRNDKKTENAATIAAQTGMQGQIIGGLNQWIDNLQDDNKSFREDLKNLTERLTDCSKDNEALKKEIARLYRKYGDDGNGK